MNEPRLGRAVALAFGLERQPATTEPGAMADVWRPYRAWVALLLRTLLEDEMGEITGHRSIVPWTI